MVGSLYRGSPAVRYPIVQHLADARERRRHALERRGVALELPQLAALFGDVAKAEGAALVPFLLAGVADGPDPTALFQPDRIHPNADAQPIMLDNVWPALRALLRG